MNQSEKAQLAKLEALYADTVFALEGLDGFVEKSTLHRRTFVRGLPALREIIDLSKRVEEDTSGGFFDKLRGAGKEAERKLLAGMEEGRRTFEQMTFCKDCVCFKCPRECEMEGCDRCEPGCGSHIVHCDNQTVTVYRFANKIIPLTENRTGMTKDHRVLALVLDKKYKQLFLILEDGAEKLVLYYYPNPSGDTYGEITDMEDLDFAIQAFEAGTTGS
ncbi:MAG: hypothetical protein ABF904_00845 [Ethanoligenens sp.]